MLPSAAFREPWVSLAFDAKSMLFLVISPIVVGIIMLIFAKPVGIVFCRLGKAIWKHATFGLTDMAFFYPEDRAPMMMRLVGGGFLVFGIIFVFLTMFPLKGPNQFKAMYEAEGYLSHAYGSSNGSWSLQAKRELADNSVVVINYRFGQHSGKLRGEWTGESYKFTEIPK